MLDPTKESRSILLLHGDKLHAHAFFWLAPLNDGTSPHLTRRHIQQQLNKCSWRRGLGSANVQPAQREIVYGRDSSPAGSLPGQNRPFRRGETRIATKVVRSRHGTLEGNILSFDELRKS
jgi:hypothetical protein